MLLLIQIITFRQVNIKNHQNYFFNSMINIKSFDPNLLSIDQISFKSTDFVIYDNAYIKSLDSVNYFYLIFNNVDGYIECNSNEERNENKYLNFASTDKNKKVLEKYKELWDEIKNQIKTISGGKPIKYGTDFTKIRFESDDDLPLGKILSIPVCIIAVGSVFQEDNNYYPQVYLHECLYEFEHKHERED